MRNILYFNDIFLLLNFAHCVDLFKYSKEEIKLFEKINEEIKSITDQEEEKSLENYDYFFIFFAEQTRFFYEFESLNFAINHFSYRDLTIYNKFHVLKIKIHFSLSGLEILKNLLFENILMSINHIKKKQKERIIFSNTFFTVKISEKHLLIAEFINKKYSKNYQIDLIKKQKNNYFDICIILSGNLLQPSIDYLICELKKIINENMYQPKKYNFGILAEGNRGKFLYSGFNIFPSNILNDFRQVKIEYRYIKKWFCIKISSNKRYELSQLSDTDIFSKFNKNHCAYLEKRSESKYDITHISVSLIKFNQLKKLKYTRKINNIGNKLDEHILELSDKNQSENIKYCLKIDTVSKLTYIERNQIKVEICFIVVYKIFKAIKISNQEKDTMIFIELKDSTMNRNLNLSWYIKKDTSELSLQNGDIEKKNFSEYLKFLKNIYFLLYIYRQKNVFSVFHILSNFNNLKFKFFNKELTKILRKDLYQNLKISSLFNQNFFKKMINSKSYSVDFFTFKAKNKHVKNIGNNLNNNMEILKSFIPDFDKFDIFKLEMIKYIEIEKTIFSIENTLNQIQKGLFFIMKSLENDIIIVNIRIINNFSFEIYEDECNYKYYISSIIYNESFIEIKREMKLYDINLNQYIESYQKFLFKNAYNLKFQIKNKKTSKQIMRFFSNYSFKKKYYVGKSYNNFENLLHLEELETLNDSNFTKIAIKIRKYQKTCFEAFKTLIGDILFKKDKQSHFLVSMLHTVSEYNEII